MSTSTAPPLSVRSYANGFGTWCAQVSFEQPVSDSELDLHLSAIEEMARAAIVAALITREQKTHESHALARIRIETSVAHLVLVDKMRDAEGFIIFVIFVE